MVPEFKRVKYSDNIIIIIDIIISKMSQNSNFNICLINKLFFVPNNF